MCTCRLYGLNIHAVISKILYYTCCYFRYSFCRQKSLSSICMLQRVCRAIDIQYQCSTAGELKVTWKQYYFYMVVFISIGQKYCITMVWAYFSGSIALISGGEVPEMTPSLNLKFQLSGYTASGGRVHRVDCYGEVSIKFPSTYTYRNFPIRRHDAFV